MDIIKNDSVSSKKAFNLSNLVKKIVKVNGAIAIASVLMLVGCDANDQIGTVESTEETPGATDTGNTTTQVPPTTAASPDVNIPAITASPDVNATTSAGLPNAELVGETVTVSTKVIEIVGPKAFVVNDKESLKGENVLVVSSQDAPPVGTNIEVTGVVGTFDAAVIKRDYDLDFTPDVIKVYENKPYLAAKAIEKVD